MEPMSNAFVVVITALLEQIAGATALCGLGPFDVGLFGERRSGLSSNHSMFHMEFLS
jgi:hypothetical protein